MENRVVTREMLKKLKEENKLKRIEQEEKRKQKDLEIAALMIKKEDLIDGAYYLGHPDVTRWTNVMMWDKKLDKFVYIRMKFGYRIDYMDYFGDVINTNTAGLAPMKLIE